MIELELLNPPAVEVDLSDAMQGPAGPPGNQQVAPASTLIGNATGAPANPTALAPSTVKAMLGYTTQAEVDAALQAAIPAPLSIAEGRTYVVNENQQVAFRFPIQVDGVLQVDGILYEV